MNIINWCFLLLVICMTFGVSFSKENDNNKRRHALESSTNAPINTKMAGRSQLWNTSQSKTFMTRATRPTITRKYKNV
ncbi:unnamed protein product [Diamesa tonsa]